MPGHIDFSQHSYCVVKKPIWPALSTILYFMNNLCGSFVSDHIGSMDHTIEDGSCGTV